MPGAALACMDGSDGRSPPEVSPSAEGAKGSRAGLNEEETPPGSLVRALAPQPKEVCRGVHVDPPVSQSAPVAPHRGAGHR